MAKSRSNILDPKFEIWEPENAGGDPSVAGTDDKIFVRVKNLDLENNKSFTATIFEFDTDQGPVVQGSQLTPLFPEDPNPDTNQFFRGCVIVGSVHPEATGLPNKLVKVIATLGDGSTGHLPKAFEAIGGGSGSCNPSGSDSGSGSSSMAARPAAIARAANPLPVALSLQSDSPVDAGHLDRPATLRYSSSTAEECCWLSPPVDSFSDRSAPAFWVLRTADATTWVLLLRRGDSDVVVYHVTTPDERSGFFPIRMHLSAGGPSWPRTVTLSPAL